MNRKHIQIRLTQGASFLLVLLFLLISAAQVLHTHISHPDTHHEQQGGEEQLQLSDKCSVCDYYLHIQNKQLFPNDLLVMPRLFPQAIDFPTHFLTGIYKITIHGFTNKGPPQTL